MLAKSVMQSSDATDGETMGGIAWRCCDGTGVIYGERLKSCEDIQCTWGVVKWLDFAMGCSKLKASLLNNNAPV